MQTGKIDFNKIAEAQNMAADVTADYLDEDIILIDNVKLLTEPSAVRLQMNMIGFCNKGRVQLELNGKPTLVSEHQIILCPPNTVFSDVMLSPDFDFKALFITNRMMLSFLREKMNIWTDTLYVQKQHVYDLDSGSDIFMYHFYELLRLSINSEVQNPYKTESMLSVLGGALIGLCGLLKQSQQATTAQEQPSATPIARNFSASRYLFQQFISLLSNSPTKHRSVEYYASELCVSPKYLSAVCKKQSGKTANAWITEHVLEDIRYCLKSTDLSVKQICNKLGFPNPSFFGKYVKAHFGMTPIQLREQ